MLHGNSVCSMLPLSNQTYEFYGKKIPLNTINFKEEKNFNIGIAQFRFYI